MSWNAPQKIGQQPFQFLPPGQFKDAPALAIMSRWEANMQLINRFSEEHGIRTSLLWWRAQHRPLLDYILSRVDIELPVLHIPGQYRYDEKKWCVAFPDCHPTRWANERLAVGVMDELIEREAIEQIAWSEEEQGVAEAFHQERANTSTAGEQRSFMEEQAAKAPDQYSTEGASPVLFGVRNGKMERNGMMLLRKAGEAKSLEMEIALSSHRPGPSLHVNIQVYSDKGLVAESRDILPSPLNRIRIELPAAADFDLYQVEWLFSYSECERPSACYSAELRSARLVEVPEQ